MKRKLLSLFVLLALLLAGIPAQPVHAAGTLIYVDVDVHCSLGCGGSWATAHHDLQDALAAAGSGDAIWVAEGVYYPGASGSRDATFTLKDGVKIYGGFNGTESRLTDRDFVTNLTILSGDIDENDVNADANFIAETTADIVGGNSIHVVNGNGTDGTTILDGFIITAGQANGTFPHDSGGGMFNTNSSPILRNLTFRGNHASENGGGMFNTNSSPQVTNLVFDNNATGFYGGGMYNSSSSAPVLSDVLFNGNQAAWGGGMFNTASNPSVANTAFIGNTSNRGGGVYNSDGSAPTLTDVIFENNTSLQGGGIGNDNSNPVLVNVTFTGNDGTLGGGIYNDNSDPILTNATISGNTAGNNGGGMYNINGSLPTLLFVTISGNTAPSNGGVYNSADSHPILHGTLIANNTNGDCVNEDGGSLDASSSHNLVEDSVKACGLTNGMNGNVIGLDPKLDILADNGGFTLTHALQTGSPAVDAGNHASCPATDQRGGARPTGLYCDIGAFETVAYPYVVSITRADSNAVNAASVDFSITFSEPVDNVHDYDFQVITSGTISGAEVTSITGDTTSGVVTVSTGTGTGTIRLDIPSGVGIVDTDGNPLSGLPYTSGETYSVRPQTFNDVPMSFWSWNFIERLYLAGITGGCGSGNYCPASPVTRAQMAVFLLVAEHGLGYVPPSASGIFNDVPADNSYARWIEQLAAEGITGGCGNGNYCPNSPVTRQQMAVFLLVAEYGSGYTPPAATGVFADVPTSDGFAPWIEQLAAEGITGGCGGGNYCPATVVNRGQMAVFLVTAFNLP